MNPKSLRVQPGSKGWPGPGECGEQEGVDGGHSGGQGVPMQRSCCWFALPLLLITLLNAVASALESPPNIVLIVCDDQGWRTWDASAAGKSSRRDWTDWREKGCGRLRFMSPGPPARRRGPRC